MNKAQLIQERLQEVFVPSYLEVIDESDKHVGHPGHQGGGRHFAIVITAESLRNLTRIAAHRRIYEVLADLIPEEIHALKIKIVD